MAKILILDDDRDFYEVLSKFLRAHGYEVVMSVDPAHFSTVVRSSKPDLIFMDITMPGGGAAMAHRVLDSDPALGKIPVIFVSGLQPEAMRKEAPQRADAVYLTKPLDFEKVKALVESLLKKNGA